MMNEGWYDHWVAGAMIDDQLWHQALVMDHVLESLQGQDHGTNNVLMWTLLRRGIIDMSGEDSPWNSSTRSMCYLVALSCHLWGLLASERTWVSLPLCSLSFWD